MNLEKEIFEIALSDIMPNRFQPREIFEDEALQELSASIKEHGVIQPIIVRKVGDKFEIIAGERRYRASQLAGKQTIPALVRDIDDKEAAKIALLENLQRRDLTPIEEAKTYQTILKLDNITQEELANNLGKSQSAIANKLRLLNLDEEVQTALLNTQISERHARSLLPIDHQNQRELLHRIINNRLTVRQVDEEIMKLTGKIPEQYDTDTSQGGSPMIQNLSSAPNQITQNINQNEINSQIMPNQVVSNESNITPNVPNQIPEVNQVDNSLNIQNTNTQQEMPQINETKPEPTSIIPEVNNDVSNEIVPNNEINESVYVVPTPNVNPAAPEVPTLESTNQPINKPIQNIEQPEQNNQNINIEQTTEIPEINKPQTEELIIPEISDENVEKTEELEENNTPVIEENKEPEQPKSFNIFDTLRVSSEPKQEPQIKPQTEEIEINKKPEELSTTINEEKEEPKAPYENIYDLRFAINNFRQAIQNTEKFGFKVKAEEYDNPDKYQIVITIDKNS